MIERLSLLFRMKVSPFSQEFRDDLGTLRDSVIHMHGLVKIANQSLAQVRTDMQSEPKLNIFARISASVSPFTGENAASCWQYQWSEVVWDRSAASWSNPTGPRNSTAFSNAINIYETTTPNSGDNVPAVIGTTITRRPIQNGRVVELTVEPSGFVWFDRQNPVEVECP